MRCAAGLAAVLFATACSEPALPPNQKTRYALVNGLVPARMTMVTAWDYPKNPLTDPALDDSSLSREIKWGYRIFTDTPGEAARFTPGKGSCNNCHLNGGQRERAMPLVGVAGMFPEYNRRAGRLISLGDRVVDCFLRSQNATGRLPADSGAEQAAPGLPTPASREVLALSAYITWLANGAAMGRTPFGRGQNTIPQASLVPLDQLDPSRGEQIFAERCTSCHGADGQGVQIDNKKAGPLWGPDSWNDGAGAARIYTLAGIIRYAMPYLDPGNMTDADAQHLASYINSKPRPAYPFKAQDYPKDPVPVDAVYYPKKAPAR
jgi:thiosulfate dehydrogenase